MCGDLGPCCCHLGTSSLNKILEALHIDVGCLLGVWSTTNWVSTRSIQLQASIKSWGSPCYILQHNMGGDLSSDVVKLMLLLWPLYEHNGGCIISTFILSWSHKVIFYSRSFYNYLHQVIIVFYTLLIYNYFIIKKRITKLFKVNLSAFKTVTIYIRPL